MLALGPVMRRDIVVMAVAMRVVRGSIGNRLDGFGRGCRESRRGEGKHEDGKLQHRQYGGPQCSGGRPSRHG